MIIIFPPWIYKAGAGDIARHFQRLGFNVSNLVGSPYIVVTPKEPVIELKPNSFCDNTYLLRGRK